MIILGLLYGDDDFQQSTAKAQASLEAQDALESDSDNVKAVSNDREGKAIGIKRLMSTINSFMNEADSDSDDEDGVEAEETEERGGMAVSAAE